MENIVISIASIPDREPLLQKTIESLQEQCSIIHVSLNNYRKIPEFCKKPNVLPVLTDNCIGDGYKFYDLDVYEKGYIFTCDDDLIYPDNYVEHTIAQLKIYGDEVLVSYHGRKLFPKPVDSYYHSKNRIIACRCLNDFKYDAELDVLGSGCAAWNVKHFKMHHRMVLAANMADIWLSRQASKQGVQKIGLKHKEGWIICQDPKGGIFEDVLNGGSGYGYDDKIQTRLFNSF